MVKQKNQKKTSQNENVGNSSSTVQQQQNGTKSSTSTASVASVTTNGTSTTGTTSSTNGSTTTTATATTTTTMTTTTTTTNMTSSTPNTVAAPQSTTTNNRSMSSTSTSSHSRSNGTSGGQGGQQRRDREKSTSAGSSNNSGYRGGGGDHRRSDNSHNRAREKDKEKYYKGNNHVYTNGNMAKRDKNRDNSSQSRRGGYTSSITVPIGGTVTTGQQTTNMKSAYSQTPTQAMMRKEGEDEITMTEMEGSNKGEKMTEEMDQATFERKMRTPLLKDTVLVFSEHGDWDKIELACEIISMLDPLDIRLIGSCIEGMGRNFALHLKPIENRANSTNPVKYFPTNSLLKQGQPEDGFYPIMRPTIPPTATTPSSSNDEETVEPNVPARGVRSEDERPDREKMVENEKTAFEILESILHSLYAMITLVTSVNRAGAIKISNYIKNFILKERHTLVSQLSKYTEQMIALQMIGKILTACIHHPAFGVTDKIQLGLARDDVRSELEVIFNQFKEESSKSKCYKTERGVGSTDESDLETQSSKLGTNDEAMATRIMNGYGSAFAKQLEMMNNRQVVTSPVYIKKFEASTIENGDKEDTFQINITWSDNEQTYASRTREQLKLMQHKLLDEFGQERKEQHTFDEEQNGKQLSSSTLTMDTSQHGRRILPHLMPDAPSSDVVQYINDLSDLPARMMLSKTISEEFYATRNRTSEEEYDTANGITMTRYKTSTKNVVPKAYISPTTTTTTTLGGGGITDGQIQVPIGMATTIHPMMFGQIPPTHIQIFEPTCSNCGGGHQYQDCPNKSMTERKNDFQLNYDDPNNPQPQDKSSTTSQQQKHNNTNGNVEMTNSMTIQPMPPQHQIPAQMMLPPASHFRYHQGPFTQQRNPYEMYGGQYSNNGPPHPQQQQQQPPQANYNNGGGGNGGGGSGNY